MMCISGVPFVWRLRQDKDKIGSNGDCDIEVRKAENLYGKDIHLRQVSRDEFVTRKPSSAADPPILKYYYMSHCKGYRWSYMPAPKSSSALYVEYTELRDVFSVGDLFYGVFSTTFADEQQHTYDADLNSNIKPNLASAICSFTKEDIAQAFNGPFKKKASMPGAFRPYDPRREGRSVSPSPYDCVPEIYDREVKNMTIDFLDPTQPYEEETRHFDQRKSLDRLNFFEEDVIGSRTMWRDVKTVPILSEPGVAYEKVVSVAKGDVTVLYAATSEGLIYKIATWNQMSECHIANSTAYKNWLNSTNSMSSLWNNEIYAYFNRTIDRTTFAVSFQSELSMEKDVKLPDDVLTRSDWLCTPSVASNIVAVLKPFGDIKTKIWDMKVANGKLVLATDEKLVQLPVAQCYQYHYCITCTRDPHCGWDSDNKECKVYSSGLKQSVKSRPEAQCPCDNTLEVHTLDMGEDITLRGLDQSTDLTDLQWYFNGTKLEYDSRRKVVLSYDSSLVLMDVLDDKVGRYELKNIKAGECIALHEIILSNCGTQECIFEKKYKEWCQKYEEFLGSMYDWLNDYERSDFCRNV